MKFEPKTVAQLKAEMLLPDGEYPFVISGAEDTISKAGNEMIKLLIRVYKPDGSFNLVNDYLLETMKFKLVHAAESCGLMDRYSSGELLASDFIGKEGRLKIVTDAKEGYEPKNQVKDYVVSKEKVEIPQPKKVDDDMNDFIPF